MTGTINTSALPEPTSQTTEPVVQPTAETEAATLRKLAELQGANVGSLLAQLRQAWEDKALVDQQLAAATKKIAELDAVLASKPAATPTGPSDSEKEKDILIGKYEQRTLKVGKALLGNNPSKEDIDAVNADIVKYTYGVMNELRKRGKRITKLEADVAEYEEALASLEEEDDEDLDDGDLDEEEGSDLEDEEEEEEDEEDFELSLDE